MILLNHCFSSVNFQYILLLLSVISVTIVGFYPAGYQQFCPCVYVIAVTSVCWLTNNMENAVLYTKENVCLRSQKSTVKFKIHEYIQKKLSVAYTILRDTIYSLKRCCFCCFIDTVRGFLIKDICSHHTFLFKKKSNKAYK